MALVFGLRSQLLGRVGEKTYLTLAIFAGIACTRAVPCGVQPVLEDSVRKLTGIALKAFPVHAEGGAGDGRVVEFTWVPALGLFAAVRVGALGPVVASYSRASLDLKGVHAELICAKPGVVNVVRIELGRSDDLGKLLLGEIVETGIDAIQHFYGWTRF